MSDNSDFGTFFAGFVIGGLVGAAVSLLLAPQTGEETRTVIKEKSIELRDKAVEVGQDARVRAEHTLDEARMRVDETMDELRARTNDLASLTKEWAANVQKQIPILKPETAQPGTAVEE